ncbi:hypothetical protein GYMLUDRAFT_391045 [Collybiopsis luxurians FD-317 M1]|uniref:Uncharacterized protein n=1 Tax=Collybiopsis luxurians FD-317 M1 TaxID=944289 RepID=A0A0D0CA38_9AGAR|nr:hypothetical protein GYMLUDRAFT_391045 [Collybiopsis luxurians FD-317 M1]
MTYRPSSLNVQQPHTSAARPLTVPVHRPSIFSFSLFFHQHESELACLPSKIRERWPSHARPRQRLCLDLARKICGSTLRCDEACAQRATKLSTVPARFLNSYTSRDYNRTKSERREVLSFVPQNPGERLNRIQAGWQNLEYNNSPFLSLRHSFGMDRKLDRSRCPFGMMNRSWSAEEPSFTFRQNM